MEKNIINYEELISKVNNIFVKLLSSVMLNNLETLKHFISEDVYSRYNNIIHEDINNNVRHMYEQLNVFKSNIVDFYEDDINVVVTVNITARYYDYYVNLNTGKYISGNKNTRSVVDYHIVMKKKKDVNELEKVRRCPNCGNPLDVNNNGKCPYCYSIFNQEDYDWILSDISAS